MEVSTKLRKAARILGLALLFSSGSALAAPFGDMVTVAGVRVLSIYKGAGGAIFVTFSPATLAGCIGNNGGYLTSTWPDARGSAPADEDAPKMQLALLLAAKTMDTTMEVRYRVNATGTGWDKCAIDAVWMM